MRRLLVASVLALAACYSNETRRERLLQRAERALAEGHADRAVVLLRQQLDYAPRDLPVATRIAAILEDADPNGAYAALAGVPDDVPRDDVAYRRTLARLHVRAGRLDAAARLLVPLERAGSAEAATVARLIDAAAAAGGSAMLGTPLPATWSVRIAERLIERKAFPEAVAEVRRLPAGPERDAVLDGLLGAVLSEDATPALAGAEGLLDAPPTARKLLARHRLLLSRGEWGRAETLEADFRRLFPEHPERRAMIVAMARRHESQGDAGGALALAEEAVRLAPRSADTLAARARALEALGRRAEARRAWQIVAEVDPSDPAAARALAESAPRAEGRPVSLRLDLTGAAR